MEFPSDDGKFKALDDINLTLCEEEFVCILGQSGSGKSTLLRIVTGLLEPTSGSIRFLKEEDPKRAIVFQNSNLLPWMNVIDNIALPLKIHGVNENEARQQAETWIERVGLDEFSNEWPQTISGGMQQRVAIARALIQQPELILLDEPFGALDAFTRDQMALELLKVWEEFHPTMLMVTHSISEAVLLADRIVVFSKRPGYIIHELEIPFPRPRTAELRDRTEFFDLVKNLRNLLTAS
ncbi:MAG: ABC transporter ATP-binding protein [Chloroflexi bacterium]|nr:ABC transporter ATP-binding protein [Chloroflexota bacterium]